jgi:hypothetical protein
VYHLLVAEAFRDQTNDLPLTPRHPHGGYGLTSLHGLPGNLREQRTGKERWQHGCSVGQSADRPDKLVNRRSVACG